MSATDPASQFRQQGLPINAEVAVGYFQSLVKNQERTIFDGPGDGDVCKNLEVYMFFVQDGLRPNSQLWMYNGLNNALIHSLFWLGKLNFLLQIFLGFVSKTGGVHPISFVKMSTRSFRAHLLHDLFLV